jgi:stage V sporulation protein AE
MHSELIMFRIKNMIYQGEKMNVSEWIWVFVIGGLLCAIAQIFIDLTNLTPAKILVTYVVSGVFLTAIGLYDRLVEFASSGATIPLTGFGYSLAKGVEKAVDENGLLGIIQGGLTATSAGISATVVLALIWSLIFKSKEK